MGIASVLIGTAKVTYGGAHWLSFGGNRRVHGNGGRCVVDVANRDGEGFFVSSAIAVGRLHADGIAGFGFEIGAGGEAQVAAIDVKCGIVIGTSSGDE